MNEEIHFTAKQIDEDGEYDQTDDAGTPVPELGSLLVLSVYVALENCQMDDLQALRRSPNSFHRSSIVERPTRAVTGNPINLTLYVALDHKPENFHPSKGG